MIITKSFLEIKIPKNTPARLKTTEDNIMAGEENALNWVTKINKIRKNETILLKITKAEGWNNIIGRKDSEITKSQKW